MKRFISLAMLLALVLGLAAHVCAEPKKVVYKFTAGEIDKYRTTMNMSINIAGMPAETQVPGNIKSTLIIHQKTLGILPDGSAKVLVKYEDATTTAPGSNQTQKMSQIIGKSVTMRMTPEGKVLGVEGIDKIGSMDMSSIMNQSSSYSVFPSTAVDVGQSWTQTVPIPMMGGQMGVTSTLLSWDEPIWSLKAAKIKQIYQADMDISEIMKNMGGAYGGNSAEAQAIIGQMSGTANLSGWGVSLFSPELGKLLKMNGNMMVTISMNMPQELVMQGSPATFDMTMDISIDTTRFK